MIGFEELDAKENEWISANKGGGRLAAAAVAAASAAAIVSVRSDVCNDGGKLHYIMSSHFLIYRRLNDKPLFIMTSLHRRLYDMPLSIGHHYIDVYMICHCLWDVTT